MKIAKERIIFNNYEVMSDEDVKELILENGYEEDEITDNLMWAYRNSEEEIAWEDAHYDLNKFFEGKTVGFFGEVGRWDGVYNAGKTGEFWNLYYKAIEDCDYIKIYDENGHLYLTCSHHDGTCHFEIKIITDKGNDYLNRWSWDLNDKRSLQHCHTQIFNRYSILPRFAEKVYGCPPREYEESTKASLINKLNNQARSNYCA